MGWLECCNRVEVLCDKGFEIDPCIRIIDNWISGLGDISLIVIIKNNSNYLLKIIKLGKILVIFIDLFVSMK